MLPDRGQTIGGHVNVRAMKTSAEKGQSVWQGIVRLARFVPLLEVLCIHPPTSITFSTRLHHQAVIQQPQDLHHDLNRTLHSSFWTCVFSLFSQAALGSLALVLGKTHSRYISARLRVISPPIHLTIRLFPSTPRPQLQHDAFRIQAPAHACIALTCMMCSILIWISYLDL